MGRGSAQPAQLVASSTKCWCHEHGAGCQAPEEHGGGCLAARSIRGGSGASFLPRHPPWIGNECVVKLRSRLLLMKGRKSALQGRWGRCRKLLWSLRLVRPAAAHGSCSSAATSVPKPWRSPTVPAALIRQCEGGGPPAVPAPSPPTRLQERPRHHTQCTSALLALSPVFMGKSIE